MRRCISMSEEKLENIKLLLIEDDEDFGNALVSRLGKRNFIVTTSLIAEDALEVMKEQTFDVIVSDITLPGMNGRDFLARVREMDRDIPVILVTGYASLESAQKAVSLNAADYLLKPLEGIEELLNPIYKAIHGYRLQRENKRLGETLLAKIKELEMSEIKLLEQKICLEQKNIALKELLDQIEREKERIKKNVHTSIDKLIFPVLMRLKKNATSIEKRYIEMLRENLEGIISSFGSKITERKLNLTPREIEICNMIKTGLTSKEISAFLNISIQTTERHRNNIRKRLGLVKKDINLMAYLQEL